MNFENDLSIALRRYPKLRVIRRTDVGLAKILGIIELKDANSKVIDSFEVEMVLPNKYPFPCFPFVEETGGRVPKKADRHINDDGTLCITIPPIERWLCRKGMRLPRFIDDFLVPHLALQSLYDDGVKYPYGEYSHGSEGFKEYYFDLFGTNDIKVVIKGIKKYLHDSLPAKKETCFCGSGQLYRNCHKRRVEKVLPELGKRYLKGQLNLLQNFDEIESV